MTSWMISLGLLALAAAVIGFSGLAGIASGMAKLLGAAAALLLAGLLLRARRRTGPKAAPAPAPQKPDRELPL